MIQANELRIGNAINNSVNGVIVIDAHYMLDRLQGLVEGSDTPIPLTEDILIKCGFEHGVIECSLSIELGNDTILYDDLSCDRMYIMQEMEGERPDCMSIPQDIKYLHQLQNLYFALTGNEIIVDLSK